MIYFLEYYIIMIDTIQYAHRLFHEPNQKFDRTSAGWVRSEIKLSAGVTLLMARNNRKTF